MPFISYAQNLEDVMLYRALRDVKRGFYVDVGANSPDLHSVTRALYERGWRGINIEPVAVFHKQLVASRPDDINLAVAIGDRSGVVNFYDIPDTGLSTVDGEVARQHQLSGYRIVNREVPIETLDSVFESHGIELVHFLKIDVEGHEGAVLRGLSLKAVRPWIIVVEATAPLSQDQSHLAWDLLLTERSYRFVYFDGLNRYYVAEEKAELAESFSSPPNIFDDWIRAHDWAAHELVGNLSRRITGEQDAYQAEREAWLAEQETWLTERETWLAERKTWLAERETWLAKQDFSTNENIKNHEKIAELEANIRSLESHIKALHASFSWRITAPARRLKRRLQNFNASQIRRDFRVTSIKFLRKLAQWAAERPSIRMVAMPLLIRNPTLGRIARSLLIREQLNKVPHSPEDASFSSTVVADPQDHGILAIGKLSSAERIIEAAIRRAQARARRAGA
jgi:FkbM family methyltransferase